MDLAGRMRQVMVAALRVAGVVFLVLAGLAAAELVQAVAVVWRSEPAPGYAWAYFVDQGGVGMTVGLLARAGLGLGLCVFSGRLAVWIVPRVSAQCLGCGHKLDAANGGVCPECGVAA